MKYLFINYCIYLPGEKAIKRTFYLFDLMRTQGYDVTFLTSDFNHYEKKERDMDLFYQTYPEYKECIEYVHMKPYKRNISFSRFKNNYICESNILKWFKEYGESFDVVYVSWPMYSLVNKIEKYCREYKVKLILDINDLWPDSLKMILKNDIVYKLLTYRMSKKANKAFSYADGIVAVSNEYLNMALKSNDKAVLKKTVYIGAMIEMFDKGIEDNSKIINKPDNEFWLVYAGTLGQSYDLDTVIKSVDRLRKEYNYNIRLKILGQGPLKSYLKKMAEEIECDGVDFLGFLEYEVMAAYLYKADVCINCIKLRASQSIINKVADYFASGKPVLNSSICEEMKNLIVNYDTGLNYTAENEDSLIKSILILYNNRDLIKRKGLNARKLAMDKFNRRQTHQELIELLSSICT